MKTPQEVVGALERAWCRGSSDASGYGVPGLGFARGEILSFVRIVGPGGPATWLWHRDPGGRWTSFRHRGEGPPAGEEAGSAATTESGHDSTATEIRIHWSAGAVLSLSMPEHRIHWSLRLRSTPATRALTLWGLLLPRPGQLVAGGGREAPVIQVRPVRVWTVEASAAVVEGRELGPAHVSGGRVRPPRRPRSRFLLGPTHVREPAHGRAEEPAASPTTGW